MKHDKLKKLEILGAVFTLIIGTLLHFVYEFSSNNAIAGIFSPVNESTFEHLKMLFWPFLFYMIFEYMWVGKKYNNFFCSKIIGLLVGLISIPVLFYTYVGIIGEHFLFADILIFVITVYLSYYVGYKLMIRNKYCYKLIQLTAVIAIIILIVSFISFTFKPPKIGFFKDPETSSYGIDKLN